MRRAVSHLVLRGLSVGWSSWVTMAAERVALLLRLQRGLTFFVRRKLALGFIQWLRSMFADVVVSHGLRHMLHRELSRGWVGWHAQWLDVVRRRAEALAMREEEAQRERDSMSRALQYMRHRELARGWTDCGRGRRRRQNRPPCRFCGVRVTACVCLVCV